MINVLIIEDQRMMRETMETYITQTEGYHLAGSFPPPVMRRGSAP